MPAPRKPGSGPSKVKATRFTDEEWTFLVVIAESEGRTPAQFIRESALGTATARDTDRSEILGRGLSDIAATLPPSLTVGEFARACRALKAGDISQKEFDRKISADYAENQNRTT